LPSRTRNTGRVRDAEATRAAILDAAEPLFVAGGFAGVSVNDIAKAARVTKSLIYHHFGSKEALWDEVKLRRFRLYSGRQSEMLTSEADGLTVLRESISEYFHFLRANPEFLRLLAWMDLEDDETCNEETKSLMADGCGRILAAQQAGELRDDIAPINLLFLFLGAARGWFSMHRDKKAALEQLRAEGVDVGDLSDERFLQDLITIIGQGVGPRPGAEA
jgi:TetR/AcrR family transcriptional regulator